MKAATEPVQVVRDGRAALAAAIQSREAAREALEEAAGSLARARQAAQDAETDLEEFSDLDERLAHARAAMMKRGEKGLLSSDLVAKREKRRAAREQLEENRNALEVLQKEHVEAEQAMRRADAAVTFSVYGILLREAFSLSDELRAAKQREWHLMNRLTAFDELLGIALLPEDRLRLLQQAPKEWARLVEALGMRQPERITSFPQADPVRRAHAKWRELQAALVSDANAPLGE